MATASARPLPEEGADAVSMRRPPAHRLGVLFHGEDPEELKVRSIVEARRRELAQLVSLKQTVASAVATPAGASITEPGPLRDRALIPLAVSVLERPWKHGIDDAYVDLDEVEKMLLLLADDQRLRVQLEVELTQDGRDGPILATESGAARGARLVQVMETGGRWTSAQRLEAEEILRDVVGRRNYLERHDVAQRRTKAGYVWRLTWVLLALIVLLAGSAALAATQRSNGADIILTVAAGAVGGAVSGLFRLRSSVERVRDLKAAWPAIFIQPVIGAVGGLVVYGLFASGVVTISGLHLGDAQPSHWRAILILAFLGGFSERFFLKSLSRLGAAD